MVITIYRYAVDGLIILEVCLCKHEQPVFPVMLNILVYNLFYT